MWVPIFPHLCQRSLFPVLFWFFFLTIAIPVGMKWYLIVALVCISLMINDVVCISLMMLTSFHINGFTLALNFTPLIHMSILMQVPYCLGYCWFVLSFEIAKCVSFNFKKISQIVLACISIWTLGLAFPFFSKKNHGDFYRIALNL